METIVAAAPWIVLLPPILAIALALKTRQVYLSLMVGLWLGTTIIAGGNPIYGLRELVDQMVQVFLDAGNTRTIFFCLMVGGLIALVQASGGVAGFVNWAQRRGLGTTRRGAEVLAWVVGMLVFVESSITALIVGAVSRPFFDKLNLPREKLAFYCDTTSAPVCMAIPLNGWGAYILGLLSAQGVATGAVGLLAGALVFNFYGILAIVLSLGMAITGWGFGAMKRAEIRAETTGALLAEGAHPLMSDEISTLGPVDDAPNSPLDLILPILTMVVMIFVGLFITGDGNIMEGSGSTSVLWAVGTAIGVAMVLYALPRNANKKAIISIPDSVDLVLKGCAGLFGVTLLIVLAFALGQVSRALEMGPYLVGLIQDGVPTWWLPALIFVVCSFVSFTLGSSWTGFAILIPIALPLAEGLGISSALMLGAVLAGGVFGDHASPLSDTTIISSLGAASDHIDHVNTQMPYALMLAGFSVVSFLIAGLIMA